MRILLDECVNPRVKDAFLNHETRTVVEMGWGGVTNGKLLALAAQSFNVFVTADKNLEFQQNIAKLNLCVLVVSVPDNHIRFYQPLFSELLQATEEAVGGTLIHVPRRK